VTKCPDLAVQPVAGRPCLIAEVQLLIPPGQFPDQPLYRHRRAGDLADKAYLPATPAVGDCHRMLYLRRVEGDKGFAILPHGPPSVHEARLGLPEQPPRFSYCTKGRAAGLSRGT
jgi:hypothetical protein